MEAASRARELDEALRQMEASTSETLTAKQAAASLEMELASAKDRHASEADLAASSLAAALASQNSLQQQLSELQQTSSQKVLVSIIFPKHTLPPKGISEDGGLECLHCPRTDMRNISEQPFRNSYR